MTDPREQLPQRVRQILDMTDQLDALRKRNDGQDSQEEDDHLDEMDVVWYAMTADEIDILEWHAPRREEGDKEIDRDILLDILRKRSYQSRPEGFTLKSGQKSTSYIGVRLTALCPMGAKLIGNVMHQIIRNFDPVPHVVAGVAVGGVPLATAISIYSACVEPVLPAIIVRKVAKNHGADDGSLLVGQQNLPKGHDRVVLVEDVTTTGGSSIRAADVLKTEGLDVCCILTLVDRVEGAREAIESAGYTFRSVYTRHDIEKKWA